MCRNVASKSHGPVVTWTAWPRCEMYISQQPNLPRRAQVTTDMWLAISQKKKKTIVVPSCLLVFSQGFLSEFALGFSPYLRG
jgi:hypothetical protein